MTRRSFAPFVAAALTALVACNGTRPQTDAPRVTFTLRVVDEAGAMLAAVDGDATFDVLGCG